MLERSPAPDIGLNSVEQMFAAMTPQQRRHTIAQQLKSRRALPPEMRAEVLPAELVGYCMGAWKSRDHSVVAWPVAQDSVLCRLDVNRLDLDERTGSFKDGITWDTLQRIKNECGFAEYDAVEIYPAASKAQHRPNIRYLWIMSQRVAFGL